MKFVVSKIISRSNLLILWRIFVLALQNFIRNAWLTLMTLMMMIIALSFALSGIVLNITSQHVISDLSNNLKVSVYFHPETSIEEISPLRHVFDTHEDVEEVAYVSPTQARMNFLENYNQDDQLAQAVELVGDDAFPPSLDVSVKDLNRIEIVEQIASEDKYSQIVEEISLAKSEAENTINRATRIQNFLIRLSLILALAFGIIATFFIFNTIRMAIFSRSEEISIMRLIGAPPYFIYGPFLFESAFFGIIAGSTSVIIIYSLIAIFSNGIQATPELLESYVYFTDSTVVILFMIIGSIIGGVIVSILACLWALQRYLKV